MPSRPVLRVGGRVLVAYVEELWLPTATTDPPDGSWGGAWRGGGYRRGGRTWRRGRHGRGEARDAEVHPVPEALELLGASCYFVLVMDVRKLHELVEIAVIRHADTRREGGVRRYVVEGLRSRRRMDVYLTTTSFPLALHDVAEVLV